VHTPSPSLALDTPRVVPTRGAWLNLRIVLAACVTFAPLVPILFVIVVALTPSPSFAHLANLVLGPMALTTLALVVGATLLASLIGTLAAWFVTAFHFPGRPVIAVALALPLALPAYVSAYAWGDILGVRGLWVALTVYVTTLYPYAYLAARAAFEAQSVCALEAGRLLGANAYARFFRIALPMARPAIAAGAALIGFEVAADYGAAEHLGVQTLTIGLFKAWFSMGDLASAARIALILLVGAFILIGIERASRRGASAGGSNRWRTPARAPLKGFAGALTICFCGSLIIFALIVPIGHLALLAIDHGQPARALGEPFLATAFLCGLGAVATLILAALGAYLSRDAGPIARIVRLSALGGYATPGAVAALGVLGAISLMGDQTASALTGPLAIGALCLAYATRFTAAGLEPLSAGLEKATRSMRDASATLGTSGLGRFWRLEAPLAAPAGFAAALIVCVEIAKELPATTILRPFGFETLAIRAHAYAADERLAAAAWPALAIVAIALLPTLIFSARLSSSRAGQA
jgi:iron(III) transport system permease protein